MCIITHIYCVFNPYIYIRIRILYNAYNIIYIIIYISYTQIHSDSYGQHLLWGDGATDLDARLQGPANAFIGYGASEFLENQLGEKVKIRFMKISRVIIHDSGDDDDDFRWWLKSEIEVSVGTWYGREELYSSDLKGSPCKHESLVEICSQKMPEWQEIGKCLHIFWISRKGHCPKYLTTKVANKNPIVSPASQTITNTSRLCDAGITFFW